MELLFTICETLLATGQISLFVALHKLLNKTINISMQYKLILHKHQQPFHDLQYVAGHALDLIFYGFWEHRITRDADSFRSGLKKSDLNSLPFMESLLPPFSEPDFPFLTPRQTQLLQPFLPPSTAQPPEGVNPHVSPKGEDLGRSLSRAERTSRSRGSRGRGRPPADPSAMLDAIFWKTAHHARWQDLPVGYPSMFPCRRYYRRIFRGGRLLTIYRALYQDFCTCGGFDLTALVERDCFEINENKIALCPGVPGTWQMRTALLFMQLAYQNLRHLRRVKEQERQRRLPHFGSFMMDRLGRIRKSSARSSPVHPLRPEPEFTFTSPEQLLNLPGFHK